VLLSILGQLGKKAGERAACVKREWRDVVGTAKAMGMYRTTVLSVAACRADEHSLTDCTVIATAKGVFSFGGSQDGDEFPQLGHGQGHQSVLVPRLIEALAGKNVIGVSAGELHTAVWTKEGELFTFGHGFDGRLGHGGEQDDEPVPRLIEALAGKKVVGAAAGCVHTAVWTDAGELFTFGYGGGQGRLGHGGEEHELAGEEFGTESHRMSLCRGWWRRWWGRR